MSQDAIIKGKPPNQAENAKKEGALAESSEPAGQELLYAARLSLDTTRMLIDGRMVNLAPGMAVTVEIKTGSRRIIE